MQTFQNTVILAVFLLITAFNSYNYSQEILNNSIQSFRNRINPENNTYLNELFTSPYMKTSATR